MKNDRLSTRPDNEPDAPCKIAIRIRHGPGYRPVTFPQPATAMMRGVDAASDWPDGAVLGPECQSQTHRSATRPVVKIV